MEEGTVRKGLCLWGTLALLCLAILMMGGCGSTPAPQTPAKKEVKFPTKPIEILVGYAAGGASDISARLVAPFLEKQLGQPVVVVNKPGGGGEITYSTLAKANPDGYQLGFINAPATMSIPLSRKVSYTMNDFAYIGNVIYHENLVVVNYDSPLKTIDDLINKAKANPGTVTIGNSGPYADDHLASLAFQNAAGIKFKDTAFQGTAPSLVSLLGGHIDAVVCNVADIVEKVKQKQVRVIGSMGEQRNKLFPDAPTLKEKGMTVVMGNYTTLAAPSKTPPEVLEKLRIALQKATSDPEYIKKATDAKLPIQYVDAAASAKAYKENQAFLEKLWKTLNLPTQK